MEISFDDIHAAELACPRIDMTQPYPMHFADIVGGEAIFLRKGINQLILRLQ
jgi:hypothetical protein